MSTKMTKQNERRSNLTMQRKERAFNSFIILQFNFILRVSMNAKQSRVESKAAFGAQKNCANRIKMEILARKTACAADATSGLRSLAKKEASKR